MKSLQSGIKSVFHLANNLNMVEMEKILQHDNIIVKSSTKCKQQGAQTQN